MPGPPVSVFRRLWPFFRPYRGKIALGLLLLLFATPIAFPPELVPEGWRTLLYINPLSGAVGLLRWALVDTSIPTAGELATSTA